MEPNSHSTSKADKAQAVLDLAVQLLRWANDSSPDLTVNFPDPAICFHSLPLGRNTLSPAERAALHEVGVQLWNACCGLGRDTTEPDSRKLIAKVRAFAYFVLESASSTTSPKPSGNRAARNAVRAAKECLGNAFNNHTSALANKHQAYDLVDLGKKIIEHLAEHQAHSEDGADPGTAPADDERSRLKADFLMLRIALAWKQNRLDLADHFHIALMRVSSSSRKLWAWSAADLDFEIGASLFRAAQPDSAAVWLRRAESAIQETGADDSRIDTAELSLNISHTLVRSILATNEPESGQEALQKFTTIKQTYGHRLPVMLLELELLARDPAPNPDAYLAALSKVMRSVHIIDANHRLIMHYLHHLKAVSLDHALRALKQYIVQRLSIEDDKTHIESAIVTLIWITLSATNSTEAGASLCRGLDDIHSAWKQRLEAEAAHAAALRISRLTESNIAEAVSWCKVGVHGILASMGEHNRAKLQRKLITCHIKLGDFQSANNVHVQQSGPEKKNPLSNYLRYVIALRTEDESGADAAITAIMSDSRFEHQLLLACISETMKHGSQKRGALLLQRILDKFNYELPADVDTCALLRCTARLHISVLSDGVADELEVMLMLCSVFRAAAAYTSKSNEDESASASQRCPIEECRWFEKTSFNIALQHAEKWPAKIVVDLLAYSSMIVYPQRISEELKSEQAKHKVNVKFLQAIVLTTQARGWSETNTIEDIPRTSYHARTPPDATGLQSHLYQNIIERYFALHSTLNADADVPQTEDAKADLASKTVTLLPLAFEAQLFTTLSDTLRGLAIDDLSLTQLIDDIPGLTSSSKSYALLADLILSSATSNTAQGQATVHMPARLPIYNAARLIGKLITVMRSQEDYDTTKAARWIRCVVQLVLDSRSDSNNDEHHQESNDHHLTLLARIVAEATQLARSAASSSSSAPGQPATRDTRSGSDTPRQQQDQSYPPDELQWLSTVLFNLAVDLYVAGAQKDTTSSDERAEETRAAQWAARAVDVADALAQFPADPAGIGGGDGGRLARTLRERGAKVGWTL